MLNSDVYWITCEMDVTCDLLCWITMILACMLVGLKSLVISLDYRSYMGSSAIIWSLRWLFLYLCSYNLDGSVTLVVILFGVRMAWRIGYSAASVLMCIGCVLLCHLEGGLYICLPSESNGPNLLDEPSKDFIVFPCLLTLEVFWE
jgi:hypothetical protein